MSGYGEFKINTEFVCSQQFERGVEAAELGAVRADKTEYTRKCRNEVGGRRSSQEARDN